jgi:hypothetical protein
MLFLRNEIRRLAFLNTLLSTLALYLLGYTACPPAPGTAPGRANVSWPDAAADHFNAFHFWTNSPSVALIENNGEAVRNRLVASFTDSSGGYRYVVGGGIGGVVPKDTQNVDGVALSDDFGRSWRRPTRFLPALGGATSMTGATKLASNQSSILAVSLARVDNPDVSPPSGEATLVVAHATLDGETWTQPTIVAEAGARGVFRSPSLSFVGSTAVATWTSSTSGIQYSTSDDGGHTWSTAAPLPLWGSGQRIEFSTVKLVSPTAGYVAYSTFADKSVRKLFVDAIQRDPNDPSKWIASPRFSTNYVVDISVVVRPPSSQDDPGRIWWDLQGFAFEVGNTNQLDGSATLYLAYRDQDSSGRSVLHVASCPNSPLLDYACRGSLAWTRQSFAPTDPTADLHFYGQYQPVVAANRLNHDVAVSWYEDLGPVLESGVRHLTIRGVRSVSDQPSFEPSIDLDGEWAACPASGQNNYGDEIASAIFPAFHALNQMPQTITLYVSSMGGCLPQSAIPTTPTYDQHVESVRWP